MALPIAWIGAALWGTIASFVLRLFFWLLPFLVNGVLLAVGLSYVTYLGLDFAMDIGISALMDRYSQIPAQLVDVIRLMGVQDAVLIITSTATSCMAIKAASGITKWRLSRPVVLKA